MPATNVVRVKLYKLQCAWMELNHARNKGKLHQTAVHGQPQVAEYVFGLRQNQPAKCWLRPPSYGGLGEHRELEGRRWEAGIGDLVRETEEKDDVVDIHLSIRRNLTGTRTEAACPEYSLWPERLRMQFPDPYVVPPQTLEWMHSICLGRLLSASQPPTPNSLFANQADLCATR